MTEGVRELVFATNNKHKLEEVRAVIGDRIRILSLNDIGCNDDIPETADTLEGNARIKAKWVKDKYGYDCFADDTGLMVDELNGEPGVFSARYAGEHCSPDDNIDLLLSKLKGRKNRRASFETVIVLLEGDKEHIFRGRVEGSISEERSGKGGFGYDPVFVADETGMSFADMTAEAKNDISHRGRAVRKLLGYLSSGENIKGD